MRKNKKKSKVIVAMSGGVDSSVAAALFKRAGFDVVGVHMKFWAPRSGAKGNRCCTPESEKRARLVAKKLSIPFYVFNFEKEFKKKVVGHFLKANKVGLTPNPCVICNKEIKFGLLLKKALALDADYVATGHYARLGRENSSLKLLKGKDKNKDQSYFLWKLNQKQLKHILFPVGDYTKEEVRKLAKKFKLPTAKTPESQEICFITEGISNFLKKYLSTRPGFVVDRSGKTIGQHNGLWFYTIGQRKGIGIASGKPYYVLRKNIKKNELVVTQNEKDLLQKELVAENVNWISGTPLKLPTKVSAKIRYKSPAVPVTIKKYGKNRARLIFQKPQRAITPGQSLVLYRGKELICGGIIQ